MMLIIAAGTPWWVTWGASIIAASAALSVPLVNYYLQNRKLPAPDNRDNVELYGLLWDTAFEADSRRILIIKTHGRPVKGQPLLVSVVKECSFLPLFPIGREWQRRRVDGPYVDMLAELLSHGYVHLVTEEMPDGVLKDLYSYQNVTESEVYLLYANGNMVYLSLNYYIKKAHVDSSRHRTLLRTKIQEIKRILSKMGVLKKDEETAH
jgi:hypothetical protein